MRLTVLIDCPSDYGPFWDLQRICQFKQILFGLGLYDDIDRRAFWFHGCLLVAGVLQLCAVLYMRHYTTAYHVLSICDILGMIVTGDAQ
jgi:hypothetical protein